MNTDINNEKLSFKSMYDLVEEFDAHDKPGITNIPTSELKFVKKDTKEKITVHMSALLT